MTYQNIKAVNWSRLKLIGESPRRYKDNIRKDSTAFMLGRAIHYATLEPNEQDLKFIVFTKAKDRRTKAYKELRAETDPEIDIFTESEWAIAKKAAREVQTHQPAAKWLATHRIEQPITWTDAETGILCKGIPDGVPVFDLKSTSTLDPRRWMTDAIRYGYPGQIMMYHDGAVANELCEPHNPAWIVVSNNPDDMDAYVVTTDDELVGYGRSLYRGYLHKLQACMETGCWPGRAGNAEIEFVLPEWAKPKVTLGGVEIG